MMAYGDKRYVMPNGYVRLYAPEHALANRWGHVMEHRKVAWDSGLLTDRTLHVHHVNHNPADNRLENLQVMTASEHASHHSGQQVKRTRDEYLQSERDRYLKRRPRHTCQVCGREFGWSGRGDSRGCSNSCVAVLRRRDGWRPAYMHDCETCGREFRSRMGDGRFCGGRCRARYGNDPCTVGMGG